MNGHKCNCVACNPGSVTPLPLERWIAGQRVVWTWHRDADKPPVVCHGQIVDPPADWYRHPQSDGVNVLQDGNSYMRSSGMAGFERWWNWDITGEIAIKYGGGNLSPLSEELLDQQ